MSKPVKNKFYAVKNGHKPGVYSTWEECRLQVDGYGGARFKGFPTLKDAQDFVKGIVAPRPPAPPPSLKSPQSATAAVVEEFIPEAQSPMDCVGPVVIYADGACTGNPGPGGYGTVISCGMKRKELAAGFRLTTNNRMEILGCIAGLLELNGSCNVTIYSDSSYVVNAMSKAWAVRWRKNGWKRREKTGEEKDVLNKDLWIQMLELCDKHRVRFEWVRGHDGNEGNERCDELARTAAASRPLDIDIVYETPRHLRDD